MTNPPTILDYLTTVGTVITPILILILTGVGWSVRRRMERVQELEAKLRDERIQIYNQVIQPFIIALSSDATFAHEPKYKGKTREQVVQDIMLSAGYRDAAFRLSLVGSDRVVKAYNELMQNFYNLSQGTEPSKPLELIEVLGEFLLEVRRGMGNENTSLNKRQMLEWLIKDIRRLPS